MFPTFHREHHSLAAAFQINRPNQGLFGGVIGSCTQLDNIFSQGENILLNRGSRIATSVNNCLRNSDQSVLTLIDKSDSKFCHMTDSQLIFINV